MARVIVSLLAQVDTDYIAIDLTHKAGHSVAAKYSASFEAIYERLAAHPDAARLAPPSGGMSASASRRLTSSSMSTTRQAAP
jgi:plasmid stabilization system protein ParE